MVVGFHRSISFPGSPRLLKTRPSSHVRSISLPCRSHPLVSQLQEELRSVRKWISSSKPEPSASICDGLARLEPLHTPLTDILNLPQNQNFLLLADAHSSFISEMVALNDHLSGAQIALRMKENLKLASAIKCMKKTEKNIVKTKKIFKGSIEEAELVGIIREVIDVTVFTSAAVFTGTAAVASTATKRNGLEEFRGLEEGIVAFKKRSERLLRCLINSTAEN